MRAKTDRSNSEMAEREMDLNGVIRLAMRRAAKKARAVAPYDQEAESRKFRRYFTKAVRSAIRDLKELERLEALLKH